MFKKLLLIGCLTAPLFATSFVIASGADLLISKKITEYSSIQRLSINKYTKGVKYQYFLSKQKNHFYRVLLDRSMSWYSHGAEDKKGGEASPTIPLGESKSKSQKGRNRTN